MPGGLRIRPESPLHPAGFAIRRVWQNQYSLRAEVSWRRAVGCDSTGFQKGVSFFG